MVVVAFTAVVAASVPHLGLVISLFGSLNAPMLSMILPPIFANKVLRPSPSRKMLHNVIIVIGVVGSIIGQKGPPPRPLCLCSAAPRCSAALSTAPLSAGLPAWLLTRCCWQGRRRRSIR